MLEEEICAMSKDSHRRVFYVPSLFTTCCAQERMAVLQEKRGPALCMTLRGQTPNLDTSSELV